MYFSQVEVAAVGRMVRSLDSRQGSFQSRMLLVAFSPKFVYAAK